MNINRSDIEIRHVTSGSELLEALTYISDCYAKKLHIVPSPPSELLVAYNGSKIIGTFGINIASSENRLRLTEIYDFNFSAVPFPATNVLSVEFCRWISESRQVSALLILEAIRLSLKKGKKYVWCEHTPAVNRAARLFGIKFHVVEDAVIAMSRVENIYKNYYKQAPGLFIFDLVQAKNALEMYLSCNSPN